jgi:hypothetical protein
MKRSRVLQLLVTFAALVVCSSCWSRPPVVPDYVYVNINDPTKSLLLVSDRTSLYDGHGLSIDLRPCAAGIASICAESRSFTIAVPNVAEGERTVAVGSFTCNAVGDYPLPESPNEPPPAVIFAACSDGKTELRFWFSPQRGLLGFISGQPPSKAVWVLSGECGLGSSADSCDLQ